MRQTANRAPTPLCTLNEELGNCNSAAPLLLPANFRHKRHPRSSTGFETLPPLATSSNLLRFLKCLDLKSVDLGLENVPFHFGWDIVVWNPKLSVKPVYLGVNLVEIVKICDEVEEEQPEVFGPRIELNLENPSLGEPLVEIEDEPSVEGKAVEELGTGDEPVFVDVEMGIGVMPVLEAVEMGSGRTPVLRAEGGDSFFEDYPGDNFEKVGEITPEETPQSPFDPVSTIPSEETPSSAELRRKRIKTLAGRTDLPWVLKLIAQRS